jgi:hypothetical protein
MSTDRSTHRIGPAKVSHDGATHFFADGLTLTFNKTLVDIEVDAFGVIARALTDVTIEVTGTPKSWANLAKLNPYASMAVGTLINGATDKPLVITPVNGQPITLAAAAVKTPPNLTLSASKPMFGSMTWVGVLANATTFIAANARYTVGTDATGVALIGLTKADADLCGWTGVLGGTAFAHEDGISVDFNVSLNEQRMDTVGLFDYSFDSVEVVVKYVPANQTIGGYLTDLGLQGVARGASATPKTLVVTGSGGRSVTVNGLVPRSGGARYNRKDKQPGEFELVSNRDITAAGALSALYTLA